MANTNTNANAQIQTQISNFPPAPDSSTDTPTEFNSKADAFVNHQSSVFIPQIKSWTTEVNSVASAINGILATIPVGTISDTTLSLTNVYSNDYVNTTYQKIADAAVHSGVVNGVRWTKFPDGTLQHAGIHVFPHGDIHWQGSANGGYYASLPWFHAGSTDYTEKPVVVATLLDSKRATRAAKLIDYSIGINGELTGMYIASHRNTEAKTDGLSIAFVTHGRWK